MNKNQKNNINNNFELTEPVILAFEKEKQDSNLLKKYKKEKRKKLNIKLLFIRLFFLVILIISLYYLYLWYKDNKNNEEMFNSISQYVSTPNNGQTFSIDFNSLCQINPSCFAYLIVNGTDVKYPVVKHTDNDYYLNHSFDQTYNAAGWIFADFQNECDGTDKNLVIYGHNRRNGSMFSSLLNILNEEWYTNPDNQIIKLYTKNGLAQFQVFSVYEIEAESYYTTTNFLGEAPFTKFLNEIKNRSIYNFNIDVSNSDQILTLSTCSNNNAYRTVLHAKKIKEGT